MRTLLDNAKLIYIAGTPYSAAKLWCAKPATTEFAVSRAGATATRVNKNGLVEVVSANVPRLDFLNGCPELLVEPTATQLAQFTEDITNAWWNPANVTFGGTTTAPDGTNNARLMYPASNQTIRFNCGITGFQSGLPSLSRSNAIHVKSAGWRWVYFVDAAGSRAAWFDLQNGVLGTVEGNIVESFQYLEATGFYRIIITPSASPLTSTAFNVGVYFANANGSTVVTASGTNGIYAWGGDGRNGNSMDSYIPRTGSGAVTRNADVITVAPPAGTSQIITTFSDDTTQIVTSIPGTFTAPNGRIKSIVML